MIQTPLLLWAGLHAANVGGASDVVPAGLCDTVPELQ